MVKKGEVAQALSYRVGSFLLASLIAWGILSYLRGTSWSSAGISFFTSGVLQFTHTGYYILFHRWWGKKADEPHVAFKRGFESGWRESMLQKNTPEVRDGS